MRLIVETSSIDTCVWPRVASRVPWGWRLSSSSPACCGPGSVFLGSISATPTAGLGEGGHQPRFTGGETRLRKVPRLVPGPYVRMAGLSPGLLACHGSSSTSEQPSLLRHCSAENENVSTFSQAKYGVKIFPGISISSYKKIF